MTVVIARIDSTASSKPYLGNLEERLGDVNNAAHLLDILNSSLDSLSVICPGSVENVLDLLVLALSPLLIRRATILDKTTPNGQQADGNDGLLVHDVVLVADGPGANTGGTAENGSLADQVVSWERVDDALGLLLGLFGRHIAGVSHGGGGERWDGSAGNGLSEDGSACCWVSTAPIETVSASWRRLDVPTALRAKREAIMR